MYTAQKKRKHIPLMQIRNRVMQIRIIRLMQIRHYANMYSDKKE